MQPSVIEEAPGEKEDCTEKPGMTEFEDFKEQDNIKDLGTYGKKTIND